MSITSGYTKYKRYQKLSDGTYQLVSQWTSSNTVHFDDGATAEAKIATMQTAIDGVASNIQTQLDSLNNSLTNYLPLTGGALSGTSLWLYNKYGIIESDSMKLNIGSYSSNENENESRLLSLYNPATNVLKDALQLRDRTGGSDSYTHYNIYGAHNKPSGSYKGNGDATARTINVGGTGEILCVQTANSICFVGTYGAIHYHTSEKTTTVISYDECHFVDGDLVIKTTKSGVNYSSGIYTYQVL